MPHKDPQRRAEVTRAYNQAHRAAYYRTWKREGRCVNCGRAERSGSTLKCEMCRETMRRAALAFSKRLRTQVYAAYGGAICACCGETEPLFLTIDHIDGNGNAHRREINKKAGASKFYTWLIKQGFPPGYRVLCQNCNAGRWRNGGVCPHEAARDSLVAPGDLAPRDAS